MSNVETSKYPEIAMVFASGDFTFAEYRSRYQRIKNRPLTWTDEQIICFVAEKEADGPLSDDDDFIAAAEDFQDELDLEAGIESDQTDTADIEKTLEATSSVSPMSISGFAGHVAHNLNADEAFDTLTRDVIKAYELVKRAPVVILFELRDRLGKDVVNTFPLSGTSVKNGRLMLGDDDLGAVGNRRADKYTVIVKKADGTEKKEPRSFFKTLAGSLTFGRDIQEVIDQLTLANALDTRGQAKEPYRSMSTRKRLAELDKWKQRKSRLPIFIKQGSDCNQQYLALQDYPGVQVGENTEKQVINGVEKITLDEVNKPYWIQDAHNPSNVDVCSVSEFLRFDVKKAKENGGTYDALIATIARAPRAASTGLPMPKTVEESGAYFAVLSTFFNQKSDDWRKKETALIGFLSDDKNKAELLSFGNLVMALDGSFAALHTLYDAARLEQIRIEAKEKAEKARGARAETVKAFTEKHNEQVRQQNGNDKPQEQQVPANPAGRLSGIVR